MSETDTQESTEVKLETQETPEETEISSAFKERRHFPIFPTNLFEFGLTSGDAEKFDKCLPVINDRRSSDSPNWATSHDLHRLEDFTETVGVINEAIYEVLRFGGVRYDDVLITSMKAYCFSKPELANLEVRPNNLLSGLLGLKMGEKDVRVTFYDPRPQAWIIKPPITQASIFNSDAFSIDFKPNKIWMFPAWLQYQVSFSPKMEEEAIYLSWTAMVRGGPPPPEVS